MGRNGAFRGPLTLSNRSENRPQQWVTRLGHKRSVRGLSLRGSIYQYRVSVDLREAMGRSHVKRSLRTDSLSLAVRLSRKIAFEVEAMFEQKRQEIGLAFEERLIGSQVDGLTVASTMKSRSGASRGKVGAPATGSSTVANSPLTLADIYDRYLKDPTKRRSDRTMLAHHTTRRIVQDVLGATTPIAEITREACRKLLEILRWLPVNYSKKYGKLTVREAADRAKGDGQIKTINPTNLNAYMARFATMLNWAVAEEYIGRNPARGLQWAETVHPQDRRKPFELWQLRKIFSAPIYTGCRDDQNGYSIPGSVIAGGARYWVPLIGLHSGMRLNEICQLDVADIRIIDGIACFAVTEESLSGSRDKSLKTKSSARIVPVHPTLLDLGLMAFVDENPLMASG